MKKLMNEFILNDVTSKAYSDSLVTDVTKDNVTTALKVPLKLFNCKINSFYKSESGYETPLYILLEDN